MLQLSARWGSAADPLIDLAVITGVAAGSSGISCGEYALHGSGFHTYDTHAQIHMCSQSNMQMHPEQPAFVFRG